MEAAEFLKKVKEYRQRQLFYLYGAEDYLIDTTVKQLTEALRVENFDFNYSICRGKAEYMEIADLCRQLPCFAQHRVVVLEDLDLFEKERKNARAFESIARIYKTDHCAPWEAGQQKSICQGTYEKRGLC